MYMYIIYIVHGRYVPGSAVSPMFHKAIGISEHKTWALPENGQSNHFVSSDSLIVRHAAQIQIVYNMICVPCSMNKNRYKYIQ